MGGGVVRRHARWRSATGVLFKVAWPAGRQWWSGSRCCTASVEKQLTFPMAHRPPVNAAATAHMWEALQGGFDLDEFHFALLDGADVHARDEEDFTVIHKLAQAEPVTGRLAADSPAGAVRRLLRSDGLDVNARCRTEAERTSLHLAAHLKEPRDMLAALLMYGADVHAEFDAGMTPLHCARTATAVAMLLAHGADPTRRDVDLATQRTTLPSDSALRHWPSCCGIQAQHVLFTPSTPPA